MPGPDLLDYPDSGFYDQSAYPPQAAPVEPEATQQAQQPAYNQQPAEQANTTAPVPLYRQPYVRQPQQAEVQPQDALTLVFKDGRPSEQIHNYMLTRTTLYIQDGHLRVIPLDQVDVAATQKANQSAGIDFEVPGQS